MENKKVFSKANSTALKGVAIIMMVFHHCYSLPQRYAGRGIDFSPFGQHWVAMFSNSFKICVSLYAFITGYGLYLSFKNMTKREKLTPRNITKWTAARYIKTMSGFWLIVVLSYIICQLIDGRTYRVFFFGTTITETASGLVRMATNFLGLGKLFGVNYFCGTWWYMSLAVLFILTAPLFVVLLDRFGSVAVLVLSFALPRIFKVPYEASSFVSFQCAFLFGMVFAKHNLLVRFANVKWLSGKAEKLNKPVKFVGMAALCFVLIYLYHCLMASKFYEVRFAVIPTVIIIFCYEFLLDTIAIRKVLYFFGKHSMNIFLTHTFIRGIYLNDFIYSFGKWWEIPIVLFTLSLLLSVIIELFKKLIRFDRITTQMLSLTSKAIDRAYSKVKEQS